MAKSEDRDLSEIHSRITRLGYRLWWGLGLLFCVGIILAFVLNSLSLVNEKLDLLTGDMREYKTEQNHLKKTKDDHEFRLRKLEGKE